MPLILQNIFASNALCRVMLLFVLTCGCFATHEAGAQPLPERRPLAGRVLTPENTPLKGATVTIQQQADIALATFWGARVATDANGEFMLPDAEDGAYYITIVSPGFATVRNKSYVLDENTPSFSITLERLVTLPLHILKPDNSVLANAPVIVRLQGPPASSGSPHRPTTDANGDASLMGLMPGNYMIQVLVEGVGVTTLRNQDLRFSPEPKALQVNLQAGGTLRVVAKEAQKDAAPRALGGATITFTTNAETDTKLAASAVLPDDMLIYQMQAMQTTQQTGGVALVTRDGDGVLQIADVAAGTYFVRVFSPAHKQSAMQTIEVKAGQVANAEFVVEPTSPHAALDVLVRDTKDKPIADTEFLIQLKPSSGGTPFGGGAPPPAPDVPVAIRTLFSTGSYTRRARTDKDGKITLYPVQPAKWRVTIMVPPNPDGSPGSVGKDVTVTAQGGSVTIPVTLPAKTG